MLKAPVLLLLLADMSCRGLVAVQGCQKNLNPKPKATLSRMAMILVPISRTF